MEQKMGNSPKPTTSINSSDDQGRKPIASIIETKAPSNISLADDKKAIKVKEWITRRLSQIEEQNQVLFIKKFKCKQQLELLCNHGANKRNRQIVLGPNPVRTPLSLRTQQAQRRSENINPKGNINLAQTNPQRQHRLNPTLRSNVLKRNLAAAAKVFVSNASGTRTSGWVGSGSASNASGIRRDRLVATGCASNASGTRTSGYVGRGSASNAFGIRPNRLVATGCASNASGTRTSSGVGSGSASNASGARPNRWVASGSASNAFGIRPDRLVATGCASNASGTRTSSWVGSGSASNASGARPNRWVASGSAPNAFGTRSNRWVASGSTPNAFGTRYNRWAASGPASNASDIRPNRWAASGSTPNAFGTRSNRWAASGPASNASDIRPNRGAASGSAPNAFGTRSNRWAASGSSPNAFGTRSNRWAASGPASNASDIRPNRWAASGSTSSAFGTRTDRTIPDTARTYTRSRERISNWPKYSKEMVAGGGGSNPRTTKTSGELGLPRPSKPPLHHFASRDVKTFQGANGGLVAPTRVGGGGGSGDTSSGVASRSNRTSPWDTLASAHGRTRTTPGPQNPNSIMKRCGGSSGGGITSGAHTKARETAVGFPSLTFRDDIVRKQVSRITSMVNRIANSSDFSSDDEDSAAKLTRDLKGAAGAGLAAPRSISSTSKSTETPSSLSTKQNAFENPKLYTPQGAMPKPEGKAVPPNAASDTTVIHPIMPSLPTQAILDELTSHKIASLDRVLKKLRDKYIQNLTNM